MQRPTLEVVQEIIIVLGVVGASIAFAAMGDRELALIALSGGLGRASGAITRRPNAGAAIGLVGAIGVAVALH